LYDFDDDVYVDLDVDENNDVNIVILTPHVQSRIFAPVAAT
jgi:hypothetical protein